MKLCRAQLCWWGYFCFLCRYLGERGTLSSFRFAKFKLEVAMEHDLLSWTASFQVKQVVRAARQIVRTKPDIHARTDNLRLAALIDTSCLGVGTGSGIQLLQVLPPSLPNTPPQFRPVQFSSRLYFCSFPLSESMGQASAGANSSLILGEFTYGKRPSLIIHHP